MRGDMGGGSRGWPVKNLLVLLIFSLSCFAAGVAYDAHAQSKARTIIEGFGHAALSQSTRPLPARILRP